VRKRILITLAAIAGLLLVGIVGVVVWYRTGGLDRWFEAQLKAALAEMNVRTEVEGVSVELRPGKVLLTKLVLYPGDDERPFASVDSLVAEFDITSYFARTLDVKSLFLDHPVVSVRFDAEGRSNLDPIELPKSESAARKQLTFLAATVQIQNGQLEYGDAVRQLDGSIDNFALAFVPRTPDTKADLDHELTATFSGSKLVYQGRPLEQISANLKAIVTNDGATIENLKLDSPAGSATVSGTTKGWVEPEYDLEVASNVSLDRIGAVADPNAGIAGLASLDGKLSGKGADYAFDGTLTGNNLLVAGIRVADVGADGKLQGERLDWTWIGSLVASRLTGFGLDVSGIRFDGSLAGDASNAAADGTLTAARIAGPDFTGSGFSFRGRADLATGAATGQVGLTTIAARTVRAGRVDARVTATAERVDGEQFTAAIYGGTVSGSARAQLSPGGTSSLDATFRGLDLDQAIGAATADAPRLNGRASGTVSLRWPRSDLQAATGTVRATVDGSLPNESGERIPLDGEVALTALPGRFRIDRAEFTSGSSRVTATGTVGWNRRADVDVVAEAADASDLVALASAASPALANALAERDVVLGGGFRFEGNVSGLVTSPAVQGQFAVDSVAINGESLGAFTGDIDRAGNELRVANGALRNPDGSAITFDLAVPTRSTEPIHLTARIDRVPLARIGKIGQPFVPPAVAESNGTLNGTIDLRAPQTGNILSGLRGEVDVAVDGATFNGEPVSDFRVRTTIGDDLVEVPNLRIQTARLSLDGSLVYDKRTSEYRTSFEGRDVDLSLLRAYNPELDIVGIGNGTVTATGRLRVTTEGGFDVDHKLQNVTASLTGTDVVLNGQQIGNPTFTIQTAGDLANVTLAADLLGERRELAGTIRLDDPNLPFEFTTELQNANLVPYASLAGIRDLPPGLSTDVTGRLRVAGQLGLVGDESFAESLEISGNFTSLGATAVVDASGRSYSLANRGNVVFTSNGAVLHFERATFTGEGTELTLEGDLALTPEATSNLTLEGDVNLALLTSAMPDAFAGGVASIQATVMGTRANPRFSGFADIRDGSLRVVDMPVAITNGNGRFIFNANQALIQSFTAEANGGRLNVDGGVLIENLRPARWRFGIDAEQVRITYPEDVRSVIDGDLALQGNMQLQVLSGVVNVRRAEYTRDVELNDLLSLDSTTQTTRFGNGGTGPPTSPIRLDLRVEARDSLVVRNNLADAAASASLILTGTLDDPVIEGRVTVSRGTIKFRSDDYQISRGVVRFPGRVGDITFDIQAEAEIRGYRVTVGLTGTPDRPYPVLRSDPPLPETQIASLILTGDLGTDQSVTAGTIAQSGVGLASSLLSAAVSESVERRTSKLFGINRFQISPVLGSSDPSARLTLGRQVNKNLAITFTTNVSSSDEQVVQVEYRISDRFSVVATREEDGAFGIDFRVKKRF
jgi:translocation and assembly module TamB